MWKVGRQLERLVRMTCRFLFPVTKHKFPSPLIHRSSSSSPNLSPQFSPFLDPSECPDSGFNSKWQGSVASVDPHLFLTLLKASNALRLTGWQEKWMDVWFEPVRFRQFKKKSFILWKTSAYLSILAFSQSTNRTAIIELAINSKCLKSELVWISDTQ